MSVENTDLQQELINRLNDRTARIAIVGIGYVGLPLACVFASAGFHVTGIDPVQAKVDMVNRGESYIMDISSEQLARLVQSGLLKATTDYAAVAEADAVSICVPTPLRKTGDPDLSFIVSATESIPSPGHGGGVGIEHLSGDDA
jgi:UDP-N-acetyl-D-glucosamine dehydrogenase